MSAAILIVKIPRLRLRKTPGTFRIFLLNLNLAKISITNLSLWRLGMFFPVFC